MAEQEQKVSSGFVKAFLPGLIVGVIVGGFTGAYLVPRLSGDDTFKPVPSTAPARPPTARELEERPRQGTPKPAETKPADKPADKPAEKPVDPAKPATPAPTTTTPAPK